MADKKKRENRITAAGIAVYPRVTGEPDTKFKKEGKYGIKVRFEATDEKAIAYATALKKEIDERSKATLAEAKKAHPAKVAAAKAKKAKPPEAPKLASAPYFVDEESGDITVNFTMTASGVTKEGKAWSRKPAVFDAKGVPAASDIKLGGGSIVKVSFDPSDFYKAATGAGVSLRLNAVQIITLVEWTSGTASSYGFGEEEGFSSEEVSEGAATEGFENEETPASETGSESDDF